MSATMVDLANTSKDPLTAGVAEMALMYSDPLKYMEYRTINDLTIAMSRIATYPTVGYRAINGSYTESTGTFEQLDEDLSVIGSDTEIDLQLEGNRTQLVSQERAQMIAKMKAWSYQINNDLINGDRATNELVVDGLSVRVGNLPARQRIAANGTASLNVYASAANLNTFCDLLDQAISVLDGGVCDMVLMDETALRGWFSVIRRVGASAGIVDISKFLMGKHDQQVASVTYGTQSIKVAQTGFTDATQATRVIPIVQNPGDGGLDATSMYFVRSGEDYFTGLQKRSMRTKKFDELEAGPQKRIRIDWPYGYSNWNDRSISRITGLRFAAADI